MAGQAAVRVGSILATTGFALGAAAIMMMLGSLVGNPPWD
jgi:hypothetical protein